MSESLFSQSWYRVSPLKPRLRSHVQIHLHNYRGNDWYVIQDRFTGRHHRLSTEAYQLIGLMDGRRTLGQIWESACAQLGDHMPTQDEVIRLLSQLFQSDLLQTCALPDFSELQQRQDQGQRNRLLANIRSPMSVRFPLLDPDRFLSASLPFVQPFLGWTAMLVWLLVVAVGSGLAVLHWADLTSSLTDSLLTMENLVLVSLIYPLLKVLHEFGHAYMVKKWGGEVHEMGVMMLVFMPIPYVDASSSLSFRDKYRRMLVGAAGIMVELFVAALALLVWLNVEPGAVRAAAFNIMLIAGVSTLLFNGNPLLRFDAYYVLADFLEIPNLGQRSSRYIGYLCQRYLLGIEHAESNAVSNGEAVWLFIYALASFVYRTFISIRIILFVAGKFFFVGILLAAWAAYGMLVAPLMKIFVYLHKDTHMQRKRARIALTIILPLGLLILGLLLIPVPLYTYSEGVVWAPEDSQVYASGDGFIAEVLVESGSQVQQGTPLVRSEAPQLATRVRLLEAHLSEYQARYQLSFQKDRTEAVLLKEELSRIKADLARARELQQALLLLSPTDGVFVLPQAEDLLGQFIRRGTPLGYVLAQDEMRVRVVVSQADIERVREDTQRVEVQLAELIGQVFPAVIINEVPAASRILPSVALSLDGGGRYALDPREPGQALVLEQLFQFDIELERSVTARMGGRVFVRFVHQPEPMVWRLYRSLRRLLLSRFAF